MADTTDSDFLSQIGDEDVKQNAESAVTAAEELVELTDARTIVTLDQNEEPDFDNEAFFTDEDGNETITSRYDMERVVPNEKKGHFEEIDRYWVNPPYAFVSIFHSTRENETKYYVVEPHLNQREKNLREFLEDQLKDAIKYRDKDKAELDNSETRADVIERETYRLLAQYGLYTPEEGDSESLAHRVKVRLGLEEAVEEDEDTESKKTYPARPDRAEVPDSVLREAGELDEPDEEEEEDGSLGDSITQMFGGNDEEDGDVEEVLTEHQVEKLLYYLRRDFIGFERIDPIMHDINVEDISCDGYNSPVFVYHGGYEQIISNIYHGEDELDDFVVKLAQRSGKGISKRQPQVDATLPDGSRSQLTLGAEVSDHGTNYTIRQFKDVPFTPIDLINWRTFSLEQMAFLWLCIENERSLIFAGGTASGKTTSLNAVSLFIPSKAKVVSIEDTREVELPQRNWIASVTRPSFSGDDKGSVDEFDLLEAALRQRPEYIVMGEIRGEEGRTLFQVMSTGHTAYTTFHADSVGEVIKRFTTEPINVSKTLFTALDLVSIQVQTRFEGDKVRKSKEITEINGYKPEDDEINVQDVYQWDAETNEFQHMGSSGVLQDIKFDRGWSQGELDREIFMRELVIAYLIKHNLNTYAQVAATIQGFMNDPDSILTLMANNDLENKLKDLREMESILIDIDQSDEEAVPRPDPDEGMVEQAEEILEKGEEVLSEYRNKPSSGFDDILAAEEDDIEEVPDELTVEPEDEPDDENEDVDREELSDESEAASTPDGVGDEGDTE